MRGFDRRVVVVRRPKDINNELTSGIETNDGRERGAEEEADP